MLNKKWEKVLLIICASWQFIDGFLTIALGFINSSKIAELDAYSKMVPISSFNGLIGTLFILAGMVNLLIAFYFMGHGEINRWIMPILIIEAIFAYFCMDIVAVATLVPAAIIISLKKKKQKLAKTE
ncbi:hypothetical protein LPAF129_10290 [Ligilactobacillus pabuli]|uniref:DUF4064 domain-containing protein n=1 Tax=Ligilactobacillus pabuli TaxID=2886039 RepID=A0ABQ5JHL1_9LACO|nr:hypothetical protein [Ligilactobacillus pabuli]GKS81343.1 hypothetical protein LPAF129_10290 [Ligilactobacillus pabuli]